MNRKELKENNPEVFEQDHIKELFEQSDKLHDLKALSDTDGGKELIKLLLRDVVNNFHSLRANYRESSDTELRATIATMNAHYDLARLLFKAEENEGLANEALDDALEQELRE